MHRTSEYGIAAHWRYKEGGKRDEFENKLTWLRSLLEWQNDMRDSRAFMENLKLDLFENQVFIFSPKGDVFSLPSAAAPLDFAYQVHTDVGHHCVGAKVNGKIVPLDYQLQQRRYLRNPRQQEFAAVARLALDRRRPRAPSTRSSSGSARSARTRTSSPGKSRSSASWRANTCGSTWRAASSSKRSPSA